MAKTTKLTVYHSEEWMRLVNAGWTTHTIDTVASMQVATMIYTGGRREENTNNY